MRLLRVLCFSVFAMGLVGCNTDMWVQPKHAPLDDSELFTDGAASRPLLPNTISRGNLREDGAFFTGIENGKWVDKMPVEVTKKLLQRGQERFDIYCTPCHGRLGDGKGMIAQRGFQLKRPVGNYHTDRLRKMPVGHFYSVITNGYGAMYSYASRVEPSDRWAIVAYIRALQLSQNGKVSDLTPEQVEQLTNPKDASHAADEHAGGGH
jgi:mono/diheme cytochrome c family protein